MKLKNIFTIGTLLFSITFYGQQKDFSNYDKNGNNTVEKQEFIDVFKHENSEGASDTEKKELSREDFYKMVFSDLDRDRNESLTQDEWDTGLEYLYQDYLSEDYLLSDKDGSNTIDYEEYYDQVYQTDYFTSWDVDMNELVDEDEQAEAIFNAFDSNDDGLLEESEFDRYYIYYLRD